MDKIENYIEKNSIITNKIARGLGYNRHVLAQMEKDGKIERLRPGLYQLKGDLVDDFVLISSNSKRIIFSNQTALFLHDLSDRSPGTFHISVPQGYNASHIKNRYDDLQVHYVKKNLFELGKEEIETPLGNLVSVYDIDRTICDIIINRDNLDRQIFTGAIKKYFNASNGDFRRLIKYARVLGIESEIRNYIEVLL